MKCFLIHPFQFMLIQLMGKKSKIAKDLVRKVFDGKIVGYVSNQVLAELSYTLLEKFGTKIEDIDTIIRSLILDVNWFKINYDEQTVARTLQTLKTVNISFFDGLIAETMKENGISKIIKKMKKTLRRYQE